MQNNRRKVTDLASQQFYKFDKWILAEESLKKLSPLAKLLYMLLRDREELSLKNAKDFTDENGCLFQYFDQQNASELLGVSINTVRKAFKDLQDYKLIESVRQGLGKPNRLYILEFKISDDTFKELSYEANKKTEESDEVVENKKDLPAVTDKPSNKYTSDNSEKSVKYTCNSISQNKKKYTSNLKKDKKDFKGNSKQRGIYAVNNTFKKYDDDELEKMLADNQKSKFDKKRDINNKIEEVKEDKEANTLAWEW